MYIYIIHLGTGYDMILYTFDIIDIPVVFHPSVSQFLCTDVYNLPEIMVWAIESIETNHVSPADIMRFSQRKKQPNLYL